MEMSKAFLEAFDKTLAHEGGFVNDPADSGGATKYGITLQTYKQFYPYATVDLLKKMTVERAKEFYFMHFWCAYHYDEIKDKAISIKVFDATVNMGSKQSHTCLQRALRAVGNELADDGILGLKTLACLNQAGSPEMCYAILCAYRSELAGFYRLLASGRPKDKKFLNGWLNRAYS